jgi:hypothetical protein
LGRHDGGRLAVDRADPELIARDVERRHLDDLRVGTDHDAARVALDELGLLVADLHADGDTAHDPDRVADVERDEALLRVRADEQRILPAARAEKRCRDLRRRALGQRDIGLHRDRAREVLLGELVAIEPTRELAAEHLQLDVARRVRTTSCEDLVDDRERLLVLELSLELTRALQIIRTCHAGRGDQREDDGEAHGGSLLRQTAVIARR